MTNVGSKATIPQTLWKMVPKSIDGQLADLKALVPPQWLDQPDHHYGFPTNGDYYAAQELSRLKYSYTFLGFLCQLPALLSHYKSPAQLRELAEKVGPQRILVAHGTLDEVITFQHVQVLMDGLGGEDSGVTLRVFKGSGHYLTLEQREQYPKMIAEIVERSEKISSNPL
ncbi:MAG: hypothetical protein Q9163_000204 [Psora crenata]